MMGMSDGVDKARWGGGAMVWNWRGSCEAAGQGCDRVYSRKKEEARLFFIIMFY